jgi:hypothetical protein
LHPRGEPVDHNRLAAGGHLLEQLAQVFQRGGERAVRLAVPQRRQLAKQQVHALADLGLGDPDHAAGAPVRQSIEDDRRNRVQADLQRQRRIAAQPGRARWQQVGEAIGQPGQHRGGQRRPRAV